MKTLKIAIISLLVGFTFASCEFLEKEPTKLTPENYFNTEEEAASFLTGIYATISQQAFYGADYMYLVAGDDMSHYGGSRGPADRGLICNNATTSDATVTALWYVLYAGINRANMFLENIDHVTGMSDAVKAQYIAEARFLRAFYYFTLVQCWGDVPFKTSSTQSVVGLDIPRTDRQTIYNFIVTEMADAAETGLKSAAELSYKPGRISQSTAWGILARVYLFRAGEYHREKRNATQAETKDYYEQASFYAQKVIGAGHGLAENYWDFFIDLCANRSNTTANESIWEAEFAGNNTSDTQAEGRIGNFFGVPAKDFSSNSSIVGKADPGYCYGFIYSTPKLYNLYINNHDIERFNWNIVPFTYVFTDNGVTGRTFELGKKAEVMAQYGPISYQYGDKDTENTSKTTNYSRPCGKFRREYEADKKDKNYTSINFPILRYSDVLLMIAEAENEANDAPTKLAYTYLNDVRRRAGITEYPETLSKEEFRQAVKDERAMELCFEYTRRFDLIRWGEFVDNMQALVSQAQSGNAANWPQGQTNVYAYFNITDTYNYFPIPDAEMSVNKAITQNNPGW